MKEGDIIITNRGSIAVMKKYINDSFIYVHTIENRYGEPYSAYIGVYIFDIVEIVEV